MRVALPCATGALLCTFFYCVCGLGPTVVNSRNIFLYIYLFVFEKCVGPLGTGLECYPIFFLSLTE